MEKNSNNYAFIDSQNLNLAIREQGWKLDNKKFRVYLKEKYGITNAYLFIGYIPKYQSFYILPTATSGIEIDYYLKEGK